MRRAASRARARRGEVLIRGLLSAQGADLVPALDPIERSAVQAELDAEAAHRRTVGEEHRRGIQWPPLEQNMKQWNVAPDTAAREAQAVRMTYSLHDVRMIGGWGVIGARGAGKGFGEGDYPF